MNYVRTYSPEDVLITFSDASGFNKEIGGWNKITISRKTPVFKQIEGIRGSVTRTRSLRTSATIKLEIEQTHPSNLVLSQLLELDGLSKLSGLLSINIKDDNGFKTTQNEALLYSVLGIDGFSERDSGTSFVSSTCYIEGYPDVEYDEETVNRVWTLQCLSTDVIQVGRGYSMREYLLDQATNVLSPYIDNAKSAISSSLPNITRMFD